MVTRVFLFFPWMLRECLVQTQAESDLTVLIRTTSPIRKGIGEATHHMIPAAWHSGTGRMTETVRMRGCGGKRGEGWRERTFRGVDPFCITITVKDGCHYPLAQVHRMYATDSKPYINDELGVILMCRCRFTGCNKCYIWEFSLYLRLQFAGIKNYSKK